MSFLVFIGATILETLLRLFPFPAKTGLIRIGNPDRNSPVLLTCNFHLTIQRVNRALRGIDAYLLVANSRGINVWCAAAGGLFTNHDVVSVLNTSGITDFVDHRNVILPQLAATGIEPRVVHKKTGWKVQFGPVYIRDIKAFLQSGKKDRTTSTVGFDVVQRFEIACSWAFPLSIVAAIITVPFWPDMALPLILLIWGLAILIFIAFPLYSRWLNPGDRRIGLIFFDFRQGGTLIILWLLIVAALVLYSLLSGSFQWEFVLKWGLISLVIILLLSLDLMGSTPSFKSSLHEDRFFTVSLDTDKCRGAAFCRDVCPRGCFHVDETNRKASMPDSRHCVKCGACIVQCPFDALSFNLPDGRFITPQTIRQYKLNLMGKRAVRPE